MVKERSTRAPGHQSAERARGGKTRGFHRNADRKPNQTDYYTSSRLRLPFRLGEKKFGVVSPFLLLPTATLPSIRAING